MDVLGVGGGQPLDVIYSPSVAVTWIMMKKWTLSIGGGGSKDNVHWTLSVAEVELWLSPNKCWAYCWIDISCLRSRSFRANMGAWEMVLSVFLRLADSICLILLIVIADNGIWQKWWSNCWSIISSPKSGSFRAKFGAQIKSVNWATDLGFRDLVWLIGN